MASFGILASWASSFLLWVWAWMKRSAGLSEPGHSHSSSCDFCSVLEWSLDLGFALTFPAIRLHDAI
jgi:hypothetical protein